MASLELSLNLCYCKYIKVNKFLTCAGFRVSSSFARKAIEMSLSCQLGDHLTSGSNKVCFPVQRRFDFDGLMMSFRQESKQQRTDGSFKGHFSGIDLVGIPVSTLC